MADLDFDLDLKFAGGKQAGQAGQAKQAGQEKQAVAPDMARLLQNYSLIPADKWDDIEKGTHIRYETTTGAFRRGGFLQNKYKKDGRPMFHLQTGFNQAAPGYKSWPVALEDTAKIWSKVPIKTRVDVGAAEQIQDLQEQVKSLKLELAKAQTDISKVISFLAKKFKST